MAVAFSTGGSGSMRSDFMISDAALPLRVEEAVQAEQTERFSQVLSGIGSDKAQSVPADKSEGLMKDIIGTDGTADIQRLAQAVADGEIKLEDIPEELLTGELFTALTKLIAKPSGKDDDEQADDPAVQEMMSELAALFTAQQTVQPEGISDKSGELSEITIQPVADAETPKPEQAAVTQEIQAVLPEEVPTETVNTSEFAQAVSQVQTLPTDKKAQPEQAETTPDTVAFQPDNDVTATENTGAAQQDGQELNGQGGGQAELSSQAKAPETEQSAPAEFRQSRPEITGVTVTKRQPEQETVREEQQEAVTITEHTAQRSRVVSKSDEFEMIKGTADAARNANTPVQPDSVMTNRPVIFTGKDGEQITVKPTEIAQQVADRLIERAADLKEGTEEYTVTLEPQDLGRITVRMTKTADGAVSVSIAAENSRTLKIIEENGAHIQDSLKQNGVQLERWQTVSESRQEPHAQDYQGSSKNPYRESGRNDREEETDDGSFAELIASM